MYLLLPLGKWGLKQGDFHRVMGVFNHKKAPSDCPIWQLKKRALLLPLSYLITKLIKLDQSNPHYQPFYRRQGCVNRGKNITAPIMNPIEDNGEKFW